MYSYNSTYQQLKNKILSINYYLTRNYISYLKSVFHPSYFSYGRNFYQYARYLKNGAYDNERSIELPIIMQCVDNCKGDILEVGNVLNQYYKLNHTVIDKYERGKGVLNADIVDYVDEKRYDLVVSISTLEHIGFDESEQDNKKVLNALYKMFSLTKFGGQIIVTVPLGHNPHMDAYIQNGVIQAPEMHLMHRISENNEWKEESIGLLSSEKFTYGSPYPYGNWVLIMIWSKTCQ